MNTRYPVKIQLPQKDRLVDLKLAVLESQLEELYPQVVLELEQSQYGDSINVTIDFATREDQVHWILSNQRMGGDFEFLCFVDKY